jgi:predicted Zn-ribbon and HTH transcriptional regulator
MTEIAQTSADTPLTRREKKSDGVRETPDVKRCRRCGAVKPREEFAKRVRLRDGRSSWCRDCKNAATRAWRAKVRDRYNAARRIGPFPKLCLGCGEEFDARVRQQTRCPECQARHRGEPKR